MKVRTYLALTATAVLIPVAVFAAAALNMLLNAERQAVLRTIRETARATALIVDRELTGAEAALRVLGTSAYLAQNDLHGFYNQAKSATVAQGQDAWIVLFNRAGQQLINTSAPFGTPLPQRKHPELGLEVMQTQKPRISNLIQGPIVKQPVIAVESPVPLDGGQRYVVNQAFRASYFGRAFAQPGVPASWVIGIFGRDGITIARNRRAEDFVGKPTVPELVKAAAGANEGVLRTRSLDGVEIYGVFTHSAMSGWIIGVGVPVDDIESSARKAVAVAGFGLLAALACAAAMAVFLGRRLARSIAGAAQSAAALGRGEQPAFATSGVNEMDALHTALVDAGAVLTRERQSRTQAEEERARLFASEQEARRQAERQNKAKDEFLAMLGHELRNPLSAITNAVTLMESEGQGEEDGRRARAVIARQSRHLGHIVDDLLDLSRVMSGKVLLNRQRIDLAQVACNCAATLAAMRHGEHVVELDTAPAWVDADPTRIEQIISNLLVNAAKYTPRAGRITVEVRPRDGKAALVVRDSGIGISAQLLPHVFDIFVQGPAQLDRAQGGLGIGLTLVRRLVALHGGTATAESAGEGQGSAFTVLLPLAPAPADTGTAPPPLCPAAHGGGRILLVEDNEDSRQTLATVLGIYGYQVSEAHDGVEGLRLARAELPEVAVVDVGLPGVDGYEVARRLRAQAETRGIALIALTGYGQAEDRRRALQAGFDMHLVKPVEPARLLEVIATLRP